MSYSPLVSVVLPNYNYAKYLENRIEGILGQTFQDFELILLDDKSTDNSIEIIQRYAHNPKVSCIEINKENSGSPFRQWAKGIEHAKGEYIWLAEADDEAVPEFLEKCIQSLKTYPSASICYAASLHIDSEGKILPRRYHPPLTTGCTLYSGTSFAEHNLYWRCYIENASAVVFKKSAYEQCDKDLWLSMRSSGDWVLWFMMSLKGDVIRIHEFLNKFRLHTTSVTAKAKGSGNAYIEDAKHIKFMETCIAPVSTYKHYMRVGHLYRLIRKAHLSPEQEKKVKKEVYNILHVFQLVRYLESANRLFRWIPGVITMKSEALPDTW